MEVREPWGWTMKVLTAGSSLKEGCMWGVVVEVEVEVTMMIMRVKVALLVWVWRISKWTSLLTALNFIAWLLLVTPAHWEEITRSQMRLFQFYIFAFSCPIDCLI